MNQNQTLAAVVTFYPAELSDMRPFATALISLDKSSLAYATSLELLSDFSLYSKFRVSEATQISHIDAIDLCFSE